MCMIMVMMLVMLKVIVTVMMVPVATKDYTRTQLTNCWLHRKGSSELEHCWPSSLSPLFLENSIPTRYSITKITA